MSENFASRLRIARLAAGLRQEDLAELAGVSRTQIVNLEADRTDPSVPTLIGICHACRVSADALLGLKPMPESVERLAEMGEALNDLRESVRRAATEMIRATAKGEDVQ